MTSAMKKLAGELREDAKAGPDAESDERRLREWLEDLKKLVESIESWVAPLVEEKVASLQHSSMTLVEPDLGQYEAPTLDIRILTKSPCLVRIEPRGEHVVGLALRGGERVVGVRGRVDMRSGPAIWAFLRRPDRTWWILPVDGRTSKRTLSEARFAEALRKLINAE